MLRPEDVLDGALTRKAVDRLCGEMAELALRYASHWWLRYAKRICLEELESEALGQLWSSLQSWREGSGASVKPWVCHGIWTRLRNVCRRMNAARHRSKEVALPHRKFRRAEMVLESNDCVDPVATERRAAADELVRIAQTELDPADVEVLNRIVLGDDKRGNVATDMGVSCQRVSARRSGLIDRLRRIVANHPDLMRFDDRGVVAESLQRERKGPKYRRVEDRRALYGFRWVEAA